MKKALTSLAFKLGLAVFVVSSISFSGLGIYYTQLFSKQIDDQFFTQARIPGRLMNQQALPYSAVRDQKTMSDLVGAQVVYASVCRANGVIHYCMDPENEGTTDNCFGHSMDENGFDETSAIQRAENGRNYLVLSTPLFADGTYLGTLHQNIDTGRNESQKKEIASVFFTGALLCILLATLVGAVLVRRLIMPRIIAANQCLKTVAEGCYSARIQQAKEDDELSVLEDGINYTVQQLEERQKQDQLLTEDLTKAKDDAERANRSKSEFLANMSHEIRTPMNGVLGMAQIMEGLDPTPEQADCIQTITTSAQNMMDLVNDILDLSRIEMGKLDLKNEPVCIRKLLNELHRFFTPAVAKKGLDLHVDCADSVPQTVRTDEGCLRQVLVNLMANAIKFTHKGHVQVSIHCPESSDTQCTLTVDVQDTGIGISKEAQNIIFKEFTQADGSHTRKYGGTGLGLSISRRIIEKMGGQLSISSEPDHGAIFSFTISLPIDQSAARADSPSTELSSTAPSANRAPQVLVVEDNLLNQKVLSKMLAQAGCLLEIAKNGKEAVQYLRLTDPPDERPGCDIVFMDIQMPVMDGLEATGIIRQHNSTLPIIALTAHAMKGDREKFIEAGMNDYLAKPIQKKELLETLHRHTS